MWLSHLPQNHIQKARGRLEVGEITSLERIRKTLIHKSLKV